MMGEDYVSFETAKLLKEKGFTEWCFKCYGVAVLHNGADISFDEECDLKDEGREDEIEYVEGGKLYDYGCNNSDKDAKVLAAPTLWVAMKWLRETHKIYISISHRLSHNADNDVCFSFWINGGEITDGEWLSYEETCESAIQYCLKNLI